MNQHNIGLKSVMKHSFIAGCGGNLSLTVPRQGKIKNLDISASEGLLYKEKDTACAVEFVH